MLSVDVVFVFVVVVTTDEVDDADAFVRRSEYLENIHILCVMCVKDFEGYANRESLCDNTRTDGMNGFSP